MPSKSYYLDNTILNIVLQNASYSPATSTVYLALLTSVPTPSDTGSTIQTNEPSDSKYARQPVTFGTVAASGIISNTTVINFPATAVPPVYATNWGTLVAVALCDNSTGGSMLYYGQLGTPKSITDRDSVSFAIGSLSIREA